MRLKLFNLSPSVHNSHQQRSLRTVARRQTERKSNEQTHECWPRVARLTFVKRALSISVCFCVKICVCVCVCIASMALSVASTVNVSVCASVCVAVYSSAFCICTCFCIIALFCCVIFCLCASLCFGQSPSLTVSLFFRVSHLSHAYSENRNDRYEACVMLCNTVHTHACE